MECTLLDGTIETKEVEEFDLMPYKIGNGIINNVNIFLMQKKYYVSDIFPHYKKIAYMYIKFEQTNPGTFDNKSTIKVVTLHKQPMVAPT